jgi:hypothetical protein
VLMKATKQLCTEELAYSPRELGRDQPTTRLPYSPRRTGTRPGPGPPCLDTNVGRWGTYAKGQGLRRQVPSTRQHSWA